jgi:hypothetical protein
MKWRRAKSALVTAQEQHLKKQIDDQALARFAWAYAAFNAFV